MIKTFCNLSKIYKLSLFCILLISSSNLCLSQDNYQEEEYNYQMEIEKMKTKPRFGLFADYNLNYHHTNFKGLPGIENCCSLFEKGYGAGFEYGANVQFFINKLWSYGVRASFGNLNGIITKYDEVPIVLNGELSKGKIENQIDISNNVININPFVSYRIAPISYRLYSYLGLKLGIPIDVNYSQYEKLVEPEDRGTFIDGTRIRNVHYGDLESKNSFLAAASIGLGYELPLNRVGSLSLTPEVYYNYWFLSPVKDLTWNISQISMGASVKYTTPPPPPPPPAEPLLPILPELSFPEDEKTFIVDVNAYKVDNNGNYSENLNIVMEDFTYVNLKPLLSYVFFDENDFEIPKRYKLLNRAQADEFDIRDLREAGVIETYHNILNIIGSRLRMYPNTKIELIGNNDNTTEEEKGNLDLSEARAVSIKNYLVDVWKINEDRIKVSARNLPKEFTKTIDGDGIDENRRVEIITSDSQITESILTFDTLKVINNVDINFVPNVSSTFSVKDWELVVKKQNNEIVNSWKGEGDLPSFIGWNINNEDSASYNNLMKKADNELTYLLTVNDKIGQSASSKNKKISINRITVDSKRNENHKDTEYEQYSLILFAFGSSKLGSEHKQTVDYVKKKIRPNSKVTISGYSDAIGDSLVNNKLALARAKAVAKRLQIPNAEVVGVGESEILYKTNLPECRFYCRTVLITIETPINEKFNE